jgi:hypothetical protein
MHYVNQGVVQISVAENHDFRKVFPNGLLFFFLFFVFESQFYLQAVVIH